MISNKTVRTWSAPLPTVEALRSGLINGNISSTGLVREALENIQKNSSANTFITVDAEGSLAAAKRMDVLQRRGETLGPLHGIPIVVKDNIFVAGLPNTAGTPALREFIPEQDALVIKRIKAAGAIVLGKTNMHELAYGITSNNFAFGPVRNAHNLDYIGGGSSGGTAAAIALGIANVGLGTDTGGSIRIPAALNGLVGFRPTTGRYPSDGITRISNTRDTVGPMAHTVGDVVLIDSILSTQDVPEFSAASLSGLRIGVPRDYFYTDLQPNIAEKAESLLDTLKRAGVELVEVDLPGIDELNEKIGFPVVLYETSQLLPAFLAEYFPETSFEALVDAVVSPDVKSIVTAAANGAITEEAYREALDVYRPQLQHLYREYFSEHSLEAVIFPTTPLAATLLENSLDDVKIGDDTMPIFNAFIRNTDPASNASIPSLTIPMRVSKGQMPMGIEIDGPEGSDRRLLSIGAAIENLIISQSNFSNN